MNVDYNYTTESYSTNLRTKETALGIKKSSNRVAKSAIITVKRGFVLLLSLILMRFSIDTSK